MKKLLFLLLMGASVIASAQNITFADTNFRNVLVNSLCVDIDGDYSPDANADLNGDGIIQLNEALAVQRLSVIGLGIMSLRGIENFTNLQRFECMANEIDTVDVQMLTNLQYLDCSENVIKSINVQGLINLKELNCSFNYLTILDVHGLSSLTKLNCGNNLITTLNNTGLTSILELSCFYNQLTSINLQGLTTLQILNCGWNPLGSLNVQGLIQLNYLYCDSTLISTLNLQGLNLLEILSCANNNLSTLDLMGLVNLKFLFCYNNELSQLYFGGLPILEYIDCHNNLLTIIDAQTLLSLNNLICSDNNLTMLNVKNTFLESIIEFDNNPNLAFVCCDEHQINYIQTLIDSSSSPSCAVSSYCSFTPGGIFYTISGANRLDMDNNGCSSSDSYLSNLKYRVSNGTTTGFVISDTSGNYSLPLQAGNYVIKPIFENPTYYTADSLVISLPAANNPFIHNSCITPNGIHHDLEISIIPLIPARPGFDATYKIVYKNKGNQPESGSFSFSYTDSLVDFISANQTPNAQTAGLLTWNFSNLLPMQSREVLVTMNCNAPTETPALNVDDVLSFNAVINGEQTDETNTDNSFGLRQTVVGSYDPNDKTCLEGNRITPSMVGNYIHYLIRFENTGTWAAENIVVKDILDTDVFDVNTLLVTDASHNAYTRLTNGNQVEFIFENIQLPFDDAHNDGYIAFKIKTKADLVVGDSIKNIANIYFDYNLPIVTNEAQTTVQNPIVGIEESLSSSVNIELFPNPVVDVLSFKTDLKIDKIEIYDLVGRLVQALDVEKNQVKIEELPSGTYLIKLHASGKAYFSKVVKK